MNARASLLVGLAVAGCSFLPSQLEVPSAPRTTMSVDEARDTLRVALAASCFSGRPCEVLSARVSESGATLRYRARDKAQRARFDFREPLDRVQCERGACFAMLPLAGEPGSVWAVPAKDEDGVGRLVDAYLTLMAAARQPPDDRAFDTAAAAWRSANPKPPLSAEGARHKVLAETAFREKDVDAAIEHYEAALESDPAWPNGNFNLALLLAETGEYGPAARHMRRYLALVPDGKDAKAANDKVIIWEDKARGG